MSDRLKVTEALWDRCADELLRLHGGLSVVISVGRPLHPAEIRLTSSSAMLLRIDAQAQDYVCNWIFYPRNYFVIVLAQKSLSRLNDRESDFVRARIIIHFAPFVSQKCHDFGSQP